MDLGDPKYIASLCATCAEPRGGAVPLMPLTHTLPQLTMLTYGRIGEGAVGAVGTETVTADGPTRSH